MSVTVAQMVSDVELLLNQGEISDDSSLSKEQIKFWLSYYLNAGVTEECNTAIHRGEPIPSDYIVRATIEVPELEETDDVDELDERVLVEIEEPLTLKNDTGIITVTTEDLDEIQKVNMQSAQLFKNLRFTKPSSENLTYYRAGNRLYINGLKPSDLSFTHIMLDYVPKQNLLLLEDDDEVLCSSAILPSVIAATTAQGHKMLYGTEPDNESNGTDVKNVKYHTAIKSSE